jgi:hypothetical protein
MDDSTGQMCVEVQRLSQLDHLLVDALSWQYRQQRTLSRSSLFFRFGSDSVLLVSYCV